MGVADIRRNGAVDLGCQLLAAGDELEGEPLASRHHDVPCDRWVLQPTEDDGPRHVVRVLDVGDAENLPFDALGSLVAGAGQRPFRPDENATVALRVDADLGTHVDVAEVAVVEQVRDVRPPADQTTVLDSPVDRLPGSVRQPVRSRPLNSGVKLGSRGKMPDVAAVGAVGGVAGRAVPTDTSTTDPSESSISSASARCPDRTYP